MPRRSEEERLPKEPTETCPRVEIYTFIEDEEIYEGTEEEALVYERLPPKKPRKPRQPRKKKS